MKTGFEFFDRFEPKAGDVWLVASSCGQGKTTLLRNLAVGISQRAQEPPPPHFPLHYWDLEAANNVRNTNFEKLGMQPGQILFRNDPLGDNPLSGLLESMKNPSAIFIDCVQLFLMRHYLDEYALMQLKSFAVRLGCLVVASFQLPRDTAALAQSGSLTAQQLPEEFCYTNAVFVLRKETAGPSEDTTLVVQAYRSRQGMLGPNVSQRFVRDAVTGRLEPR